MASSSTSCFQSLPQVLHQPYEIAAGEEDRHRHAVISAAFDSTGTGFSSGSTSTKSTTLLYNFSVLSDKVHQVQSLVTLLISPGQAQTEQASMAVASMETLIQEIIFAASSMMFICQQMAAANNNTNLCHDADNQAMDQMGSNGQAETSLYPETGLDWYDDHRNNNRPVTTSTNNSHINPSITDRENKATEPKRDQRALQNSSNHDIIELDAAELLAKYTHYCQICGKGFKRDANLRMHMRAHGDEYKSRSALSNPLKKRAGAGASAGNDPGARGNIENFPAGKSPRKYSCPQEGCRWNQRHAKFQPLKSLICVKNHYKRSHCPKMYVCKRCNRKQFSVLSDLRTHEKHCMVLKWQCSCGTTFSRKDKLMGHVALFTGHLPMTNLAGPATQKAGQWSTASMQMGGDGRGNV